MKLLALAALERKLGETTADFGLLVHLLLRGDPTLNEDSGTELKDLSEKDNELGGCAGLVDERYSPWDIGDMSTLPDVDDRGGVLGFPANLVSNCLS